MINTLREPCPNLLVTDDVASTQHDEGDVGTLGLDALCRRVVGLAVPQACLENAPRTAVVAAERS